MALALCEQVRPMCDELVISECGHFHPALKKIADVYLKHEQRLRHGDNLNAGIAASHGDFLACMDSDVTIERGSLRQLCIPGKVVCPEYANQRDIRQFHGVFFVSPREILEELPIFERGGPEGIDHWVIEFSKHLNQRGAYLWTDEVSYRHLTGRSYGELANQAWLREQERMARASMHREIAPDRHRQRLLEDVLYAEMYGGEE